MAELEFEPHVCRYSELRRATYTWEREAVGAFLSRALAYGNEAALESAERVARALGWQVVAVDAKSGRLEATATSRLFGFVDDVVVRITPTARGCVVDVRSLSRVGGSDFGANARRVRSFIDRLQRDVV